ncbi:MAG: hypothetical protein WDN44_15845 [Sphingomonas sp.]
MLPTDGDFDPDGRVLASLATETSMLLPHALREHRSAGMANALTLLIPPRMPPEAGIRRDDVITSFLASGPWARRILDWRFCAPSECCFRALSALLDDRSASIVLHVVHKTVEGEEAPARSSADVDVVLAHRGSDDHLRAALSSILMQTHPSRNILCFDQIPDPSLCSELIRGGGLELFEVVPSPAGPYVPRGSISA